MYQMEAIRPSIERLSLAIANSLRLEIAIFDRVICIKDILISQILH